MTADLAQEGDTVQVHYTGSLDDGSVFDSSREGGDPLAFVVGTGQVIEGFDQAVLGMTVGTSTNVRLEPEQAYGERDERLVMQFPRADAPEGLSQGDHVQVGGQVATVVSLDDSSVTIDANHPLAGQPLTFEIELVGVEKA